VSKENFDEETKKKSLLFVVVLFLFRMNGAMRREMKTAALRCGVGHDFGQKGSSCGRYLLKKKVSLA
jgi:hypothetical protein